MARILVVEDEKDLQEVLAYNLRQAGHTVLVVGSGRDALAAIPEQRPDLLLLDLMLPDVSGVEICRKLKGDAVTRDLPIVMVTAKGDEVDRVVGFELGADDYVVKPYSLRELLLRIDAVLRRTSPTPGTGPSRGVMVFGKLRVDRDAHRVWVDDDEVTLTALELRLLSTLLERRGRVQSRPALLDDVWGMSGEVTTRTVDTHVKRLREKLGSAGPYIETVRGVGYRFTPAPDHAATVGVEPTDDDDSDDDDDDPKAS
jgi:two-component system phosphate regulon response regulator PhoB